MALVTCPSCGEKGRIPKHLIGKRVKCQKCGTGFLVAAAAPKEPVEAVTSAGVSEAEARRPDTIAVVGLDDSAWSASAVVSAEADHEHEHEHEHDESSAAFTASPHEPDERPAAGGKRYMVLTSKDRFFGGKFELGRLEDALNHYARQGWVVRSMATPHVTGFSGGPKEELVVLLEK